MLVISYKFDRLKNMKIGRNQSCHCGSGKKYKKCCLDKEEPTLGHKFQLKGKKAEEYVYKLAKKSFFEDWCYINPKFPDGKELCDVLVVFGDTLIIWQIKDLKLKNGKYDLGDVEKNLRQLCGAKRKLFGLKQPIELENARAGKEKFDTNKIKKVYLISGLVGEGEDYFSFAEFQKENHIHTFTREFTELVLRELDTIEDFIGYIQEKEKLLSLDSQITLLGGEKDLLAHYLMNQRNFGKLMKANLLMIDEGCWEELQKRPEYIAKKVEDEISYFWDDMINRTHTCGKGYETIARELARPNRFERRYLSKAFLDAHKKAYDEIKNNMFRRLIKGEGITYCFMFTDHKPRKYRKIWLENTCLVARGLHQDNQKVLGIATEMKIAPECSYDFCFLNLQEWKEENQREMRRIQKETGIFTNYKEGRLKEDEYPLKHK